MAENTYAITEVVGSSTLGVDDAVKRAIERASKSLRHLDWFEVTEIRGHIENDTLRHFQVSLKVGYRLEEPG